MIHSAAISRPVPAPAAPMLLLLMEGTRFAHCVDDAPACRYRIWFPVFVRASRRSLS